MTMNHTSCSLILIGALSLTLLACKADPVSPLANAQSPAVGFAYFHPAASQEKIAEDEQEAVVKATMELVRTLSTASLAHDRWQDVDTALRAALASSEVGHRSFSRAMVSTFMLETYLLSGTANTERQEAIAHHAEELVATGSARLGLVLDAADRLEGYWPEERREALVAQATESAQAFVAVQAECDGCSFEQAVARIGASAEAKNRTQLTETLAALDRVAR